MAQQDILDVQKETLELVKSLAERLDNPRPSSPPSPPVPGPDVPVPIPRDCLQCPKCLKDFSSHYRCVLHYRVKHLQVTKWQCDICKKYLSSEKNLDEHIDRVHQEKNFTCGFCKSNFESRSQCEKHMETHKSYHKALKKGKVCDFCYQAFWDVQHHMKTCKHNANKTIERSKCRNKGCDSTFTEKKHRNYHETYRCKYGPMKKPKGKK